MNFEIFRSKRRGNGRFASKLLLDTFGLVFLFYLFPSFLPEIIPSIEAIVL